MSVTGVHRYDNMIKSMIARLEVTNSLAPVQDIGRHQKAREMASQNGYQEEKYFDLDDDFIDDA